MKLEVLAISDTHLGEDCSLLSFPQGRQRLWDVLRKELGQKQLGENEKFDVEEMILMGDIPDRTLSSTSQIVTHTNAFIETLGSAAKIKKGVYIPGNHDHTVWTKYRVRRFGAHQKHWITAPAGDPLIKQGKPQDESSAIQDLLSLFFGYPCGSSWRAIKTEGAFDFVIANPLYARKINDRTYVFAHGTHFRWDVTLPSWQKELGHDLRIDRIFGGIKVKAGEEILGNEQMEDLERKITPFVDSLWPSSRNNPTTQRDELWYFLTHLSGKFEGKRKAPKNSQLFKKNDLRVVPQDRIRRLTSDNDNLQRFSKNFCTPMLEHLKANDLLSDKVTFVYGDTHAGGWLDSFKATGVSDFFIYNTGGWVVENEGDHPACHIFGVSDNGEEFILDVSFDGVNIDGDPVLELAAQEAEHRKNIGNLADQLCKLIDLWRHEA